MAKKLSLYVEDTDLRLLLTSGKEVEKWASVPLTPGLVSAGVIVDEELVGHLLREQLRTLRINTKGVILGLPGLNSLYRIVNIPELPESMVAEAMRHEAERVLPVALNDVYLAYQPVMIVGAERRYFLAAFPKNATDAVVRTVRNAGLEPYLMDLGPLAFCRSVVAAEAVVVNAQGAVLDLAVMAERVPQVIRSLHLPGETESQTDRLVTIAEEIERTIAFYNSSEPEKPLDSSVPVLVCGDLTKAPDSWTLLQSRLEHTISVLPPPMDAPPGFDSCKFMVNMGLALKEMARGKNALEYSLINFDALPEAYRPKHVSPINIVAPVAITVSLAIILLLAYLINSTTSHIGALRSELTTMQNSAKIQQNDITALKANLDKLAEAVKPIDLRAAALTGKLAALRDSRLRVQANTGEMVSPLTTQLTPPVETLLTLSQINYTAEGISINGTSAREEDFYAYVRALKGSQKFSDVTVFSFEWSDAAYEFVLNLSEK